MKKLRKNSKSKSKQLTFTSETVRVLQPGELTKAVGGLEAARVPCIGSIIRFDD